MPALAAIVVCACCDSTLHSLPRVCCTALQLHVDPVRVTLRRTISELCQDTAMYHTQPTYEKLPAAPRTSPLQISAYTQGVICERQIRVASLSMFCRARKVCARHNYGRTVCTGEFLELHGHLLTLGGQQIQRTVPLLPCPGGAR